MRWRLRTKILLSVGLIIFLILGATTIVHVQHLRQDCIEGLNWLSEAPSKYLAREIATLRNPGEAQLKEALGPIVRQCIELYKLDEENHVSHLAILDEAGKILAHTYPELVDTVVEETSIIEQLGRHQPQTILEGTTYHLLIPVFQDQGDYLATIIIGVPKQVVDEKVNAMLGQLLILFLVFLGLSLLIVWGLLHVVITKPAERLVTVGEQLATGQLVQSFQTAGWDDEISSIGRVFYRIASYLHHVADMASRISTGKLQGDIQIRSKQDVLGNALHDMMEYLRYIASVATRIAEGDLTEAIQIRSAHDAFGQAIQVMTGGLRMLIDHIKRSADQINSTGTLISSLAVHDNTVIRDVHASVNDMAKTMQGIGTSVEKVVQDMDTLASAVQDSADSVLLITSSITLIAANAEELTTRSQLTIEALKNAVQGLESVVENTDKSARLSQATIRDSLAGQEAFDQVMKSMETIQQTITTAVDSITIFARRSSDIDRILEVIREITERTTLLALNASIIAAQAGTHGRGFAVVADEIKNLADGVNVSTKDIAAIVHALQQDTNTVVQTIHEGAANVKQGMERTEQARETLQKIIDSAQRSSTVVTEIADALHQVTSTSRGVVAAMEEVGAMTEDFTTVTNEQEMGSEQINKAIVSINEMTSQVFQETAQQFMGIQNMLEAAKNITVLAEQSLESSQKITSTTEDLSDQADLLLRSVDRFKLSEEPHEIMTE